MSLLSRLDPGDMGAEIRGVSIIPVVYSGSNIQ